ncbi:MAG: chemotaxis protein CheW [Bdellovibrionota bacterium]
MSLEEALSEFIEETNEMLDRINIHLANFEKTQNSPDTLNIIYRDLHTIKGSAQLFGCIQMGQVAHAMEACLDPIREGILELNNDIVNELFNGLDILRIFNNSLKKSGVESNQKEKLSEFIPKLNDIILEAFNANQNVLVEHLVLDEELDNAKPTQMPKNNDRKEDPIATAKKKYQEKLREKKLKEKQTESYSSTQNSNKVENTKLQKQDKQHEQNSIRTPSISISTNQEYTSQRPIMEANNNISTNETIRVQVDILDSLVNMVGELVLVRNQLVQFGNNTNQDEEFLKISHKLNAITSDLQNEVMKTRMQPIGNVLTKFHRVVRDISKSLNKEINLTLKGVETELDKTLIEAVKDPLTHIVRNSADHGLESPEARKAAGKDPIGNIIINSYHEGGHVIVEVRDDGAGLSRERIANKAIEKGIINESSLSKMSDRDVHNLIFTPGFSTAGQVSNISGRGVGMDVVRTNIEQIGGVVDLHSIEGEGTCIKLKIPLTLAIVPALIVHSAGESFAIPQVKLVELVRVENNPGEKSQIQSLHGKLIYALRDKLLPLVDLSEILQINKKNKDSKENNITNIVVLNADTGYFGLIVDSIEDSIDIVVKPLANLLKEIGIYSGATVLGDGSVTLTLDVLGLASHANLLHETSANNDPSLINFTQHKEYIDSAEYLMIDLGTNDQYCIPLCMVNRLEEFGTKEIQMSGKLRTVKYRDSILPLINVGSALEIDSTHSRQTDKISVIVIEKSRQLFGLEVTGILDVININNKVDTGIKDRPGILGSILDRSNLIVVIDVLAIISDVFSQRNPVNNQNHRNKRKNGQNKNVLVVEDNNFFRRQIQQILENEGYAVTTAHDGEEGLGKIKSNIKVFDVIISDIEMPLMGGLELAQKIRNLNKYISTPLIAMTTKFRKKDIEKGLASGFDCYLEKLNQSELVDSIENLLQKNNKEIKREA